MQAVRRRHQLQPPGSRRQGEPGRAAQIPGEFIGGTRRRAPRPGCSRPACRCTCVPAPAHHRIGLRRAPRAASPRFPPGAAHPAPRGRSWPIQKRSALRRRASGSARKAATDKCRAIRGARHIGARQLIQQLLRLGDMAGAAGHGARRAGPAAHDGAAAPGGAGSCDQRLSSALAGSSRQRRPRACTQARSCARGTLSSGRTRTACAQRHHRRHGRQSRQSGTAQQLQQHRLELVLQMMGGQQHLARAAAPRPAPHSEPARATASSECPRARGSVRRRAAKGTPQRAAAGPAGARPGSRVRVQAVIDVHGAQARLHRGQFGQQAQQRGGILAAAEGDAQRCARAAGGCSRSSCE